MKVTQNTDEKDKERHKFAMNGTKPSLDTIGELKIEVLPTEQGTTEKDLKFHDA